MKNFLPLHVLRILYNSLIFPHLQYGILTWGFCLGRLQKLQKRSQRIITRSKYNAHTDPLFKSLNLLKLKDLFELSVFKIYFKFTHNLLPVYILNMFTESIRNHRYNLRTRGPLEFVNSSTASGEKCLRCYLPNFINNSSSQVLDKINTHSYEGFSFFIKRTTLNSYRIECTVPNCYICSNCPWFILYWYYCIVLCISRLPRPRFVSLIWSSVPNIFFSMSLIFSVFLLGFFCFFLCVFLLNWFLSLKFANYVIYAWFSVQYPDTIIIFCMYNSACKPVQITKKSMEMLTIVSAIACRFCLIIHRSSKFEVSF